MAKKNPLRVLNKSEIDDMLQSEVFSNAEFNNHIEEVSNNLGYDKELVSRVIRNYITNIVVVINTVRNFKRKINVYGFFSLTIGSGKSTKKQKL